MPRRIGLPLLLVVFVAQAIAYSVTLPLGEAADEVTHFAYVQYLVAHRQLPSATGAVLGESQQPPLYYLLGAIATFWVPQQNTKVIANPDYVSANPQTPNLLLHTRREAFPYYGSALAWHLVRLLSVLMGAVTVWATWRIAHNLFPDDSWITFGATAFVAFLPGFLLISAVVNNDNLVIMLTSLSVLQVLSMRHRAWNARDAIVLGVLLGLALLTKVSALVVWAFAGALLVYYAFESKEWRKASIHIALCFGTAAALFAPWALFNFLRFGDPLAWSVYLSIASIRTSPMVWQDWVGILGALFTSSWGRFGGSLELTMPSVYYAALGGLIIAAIVGWLGYARDAIDHHLNPRVRTVFVLSVLFWLILLAAYVRWSLNDLAAGQARLLFPGLPLLATIVAAGFARLSIKHKGRAVGALCGSLVVAAWFTLFSVNSAFAAPRQNIRALPWVSGSAAPADFGQTIRIVDYRIDQTQVAPGGPITTQFYWQALNDPSQDYWLLLQLADKNGAVANKDGVPSAGRVTTDWWLKGQTFESSHTIIVPKDTAPGTYTLRIGLHPFGKWEWLPVDHRDMLDLGTITVR